jgi:hypothetical protein
MQSITKHPTIYEIKLSGRLGPDLAQWLGDLSITVEEDGTGTACTTLTGPLPDQSALFGILNRIRDLGLRLISVNIIEPDLSKGTPNRFA